MWRLPGLCGLLALLALSAVESTSAAEGGNPTAVYSIQVRAVPFAEREDGMATYRQLKDKGYLVYAYVASVDGAPWLRIAVGAFHSRGAAADFGRAFATAEDMDHFVAAAPVLILPGAEERDFVVTPSALWVRGSDGAREVYGFTAEAPNRAGLPTAILPELSPDGEALAFVYDTYGLIIARQSGHPGGVQMEHGYPYVTPDADHPWRPAWSPSGDYVAFLGKSNYRDPFRILWMAPNPEGWADCLSCGLGRQHAVEWFVWHPSEDRVLFIEQFVQDTGAIGGRLFSAEMDGTKTEIAAVERIGDDEIAGPLRIEDGRLHYRRVRWLDDRKIEKTITDESIPVDAL